MKIRKYNDSDCETVSRLFFNTVHTVNSNDYTAEQLAAWADNEQSLTLRRNDLLTQKTLIAEKEGKVAGFGSIDISGNLDLLFVHKDYQRQGIATALCNELENGFAVIKTYASVTAKKFFEYRGYKVIKEQEAERRGIKLKNFEMIRINIKQSGKE